MFNSAAYLIKEGFLNVFKNKLMFFVTISIICASMIVLGVFMIIGENTESKLKIIEQGQQMQAFLESNLKESQIDQIEQRLKSIEDITNIEYESKQKALENAKKMLSQYGEDTLQGYEKDNFFDPSFIITVKSPEVVSTVEAQVKSIFGVRSVVLELEKEALQKLIQIIKIVRIVILTMVLFLLLISLLITINTIKLALHSRKREINIMKYVGATDWFIRWPFIIEGVIMGIIGAFVSLFVVSYGYDIVVNLMIKNLGNFEVVAVNQIYDKLLIMYMLIGVGIGGAGSIISIRKYLKV